MFLAVSLIYLSALTVTVKSGPPNCGTRNQFREYRFPFVYCDNFKCEHKSDEYFRRSSVLLKIQQTKIIPTCAVTNSTSLRYITGINSNIQVLTSGSFVNLPNLESILLPFNEIRELHQGIFYNVNVSVLDLSWNKIVYISEGAFDSLTGLKHLNLSRNELTTLPIESLPRSIARLDLSYNLLKRIALNGANKPHLVFVDLSYNNLKNIALLFENRLEELDLSHNDLTNIDFYDINDCENLKIPSNMFSHVPEFMSFSKIHRVAIHPNPWKCDELNKLWIHLQNNYVEEEILRGASRPLCSNTFGLLSNLRNLDLECDNDNQCPRNLLCRAHKCLDPCINACDKTNICNVKNHKIECLCSGKKKKNPQEIFSPCYDVECFIDSDCFDGRMCNYNKKCILLPASDHFNDIPNSKITVYPQYLYII